MPGIAMPCQVISCHDIVITDYSLSLCSQAISSTTERRMTLSQIYDWMVAHIPYFTDRQSNSKSAGWKVKFLKTSRKFSAS